MKMSNTNSVPDELGSFSEQLQTVLPTNNLPRETLAELIGSVVEYHTGIEQWEFKNNELRIDNSIHPGTATAESTIHRLHTHKLNAVREIEFPQQRNDNLVVIKFH
jgi:hypothetical protein